MTKIGLALLSLLIQFTVSCGTQAQPSEPAVGPTSQVRHDLSFAQHASLDFQLRVTPADGRRIARDVSKLLQTDQGALGEKCNVEFNFQGEIGKFLEHEIPFAIRNQTDFDNAREHAFQTTFAAFIVGRIAWCGRTRPGIRGCSDKPGRLMLIESPKSPNLQGALGGLLVVHELMHTSGSPHNPKTQYILYEDISKGGPGRTAVECQLLATNLGGRSITMVAGLRVKKDDLLRRQAQVDVSGKTVSGDVAKQAGFDSTSQPALDEFVEAFWMHGVPYQLAQKFSEVDAETLIRRLATETNENVRANIVATLGAIGSKTAVDTLSGIVLSKRGEELSSSEYSVKADAMIALAWASGKRAEAADLLLKGLQPGFWAIEGNWRAQGRSMEQVAEDLAKDAAQALALVGTPAAQQSLKAAAERAEREVEGARVNAEAATRRLKELEGRRRRKSVDDAARALSDSASEARNLQAQKSRQKSFYDSVLKDAEKASRGLDAYYAK